MSDRPGSGTGVPQNIIFAGIFVAIGAAMGIHAALNMNLGTLDDMGPGFFPLLLSIVLAILSIGVAFSTPSPDRQPLRLARPRAIILILLSPVIFAATIRTLGLVPALLITIFAVSFASRLATFRQSAILSIGFTVFCVLIFGYLLNMPIPFWGTLFTG
ncbi:tripartite tricarboxylate transporter TctB family protein [Mesorhizobium sp. J428]|uniref:tripartite tricarboxylate transporter TctB family protein n=1 Tax=Mesorhizobium sp. J428 TaxID=2898440 RepID=UPI002151429A|nr:tripartite tricarboxylate transporter TctB family protein [Mesorhizobium sp. J428]MCR5856376.1 tripartite tricarboxylate transporter TctB family protein [Mesorhizobium sp. J428]